MFEWYKNTLIEEKMLDFNQNDIREIKKIDYYIDYNQYYEEVSFVKIVFLVEYKGVKKELEMIFKDVTNLKLNGIGGPYNQILGFNLERLDSGYDSCTKYKLEDYEEDIISLYCKEYEVLSIR